MGPSSTCPSSPKGTPRNTLHTVAVLRLINQKGLNIQCRKLAKAVDKLAGTQENLQKPTGPKGESSKEDQEFHKVKIIHTQEMLKEAQNKR
jgi:hypothetical protein